MNKEIWKETPDVWRPVPDYEGLYEASHLGEIRSIDRVVVSKSGIPRKLTGRVLAQRYDKDGYLYTDLPKNGKLRTRKAHRLVIAAFRGKEHLQVDHINNKKDDNRLGNLQYVTHRENNFKSAARKEDFYLSYDKKRDAWSVLIKNKGKRAYVGYSRDKEEAKRIRDRFIKDNPEYSVRAEKVYV